MSRSIHVTSLKWHLALLLTSQTPEPATCTKTHLKKYPTLYKLRTHQQTDQRHHWIIHLRSKLKLLLSSSLPDFLHALRGIWWQIYRLWNVSPLAMGIKRKEKVEKTKWDYILCHIADLLEALRLCISEHKNCPWLREERGEKQQLQAKSRSIGAS